MTRELQTTSTMSLKTFRRCNTRPSRHHSDPPGKWHRRRSRNSSKTPANATRTGCKVTCLNDLSSINIWKRAPIPISSNEERRDQRPAVQHQHRAGVNSTRPTTSTLPRHTRRRIVIGNHNLLYGITMTHTQRRLPPHAARTRNCALSQNSREYIVCIRRRRSRRGSERT